MSSMATEARPSKLDPRVYMNGQADRRYMTEETREMLAARGLAAWFSFGLYEIRKSHKPIRIGLCGDDQVRAWLAQYAG